MNCQRRNWYSRKENACTRCKQHGRQCRLRLNLRRREVTHSWSCFFAQLTICDDLPLLEKLVERDLGRPENSWSNVEDTSAWHTHAHARSATNDQRERSVPTVRRWRTTRASLRVPAGLYRVQQRIVPRLGEWREECYWYTRGHPGREEGHI